MSKVGFVTTFDRTNTKLSIHFGMSKWVAVMDSDSRELRFVRNTGLTGRSVIDILKREGCEEVVFRDIGAGALRQLKAANIAGWHAVENKTVPELYAQLLQGRLRLARGPTKSVGRGSAGATRKLKQSKEKA